MPGSLLLCRALAALARDGVIEGFPDEVSMLLGPAYVGYTCSGHSGCGAGRQEEACLSVHGALVDVARGVAIGGPRRLLLCWMICRGRGGRVSACVFRCFEVVGCERVVFGMPSVPFCF